MFSNQFYAFLYVWDGFGEFWGQKPWARAHKGPGYSPLFPAPPLQLLSVRSKPFAVRVFAEELTWHFFRTFRS